MEKEKPDYHLNNGDEPQKVEKDSQQFTSGTASPQNGETIAAKGEDLTVGEDVSEKEVNFASGDFAGFDWEEALRENAIPVTEYSKIAEANAEQIHEAEMKLGEMQEAVYNSYGEMYELDSAKLAKATTEELEGLIDAMEDSRKLQETSEQIEKLKKEIEDHKAWATFDLTYVWKGKYSVGLDEYPQLKDSIPAKLEWLKQNKPDETGKIYALENFESNYEKLKEMESKLEQLESDSPKGDPSEWEKTIAKFQNPNNLYSMARKNKALWFKSADEAYDEFTKMAKGQRKLMTPEELQEIKNYTGFGSYTINNPLNAIKYSSNWGNAKIAKQKGLASCRLLTKALDKSKSTKDIWLQRGVGELHMGGVDFSELYQGKIDAKSLVGREFVNNGFMSCGSSKGTGFSSQPLIMNIYCPKGTKMHYIGDKSGYGLSENETLIQRGYHFKITKVTKKGNKYFMDVDLLLGSDADRIPDSKLEGYYDKYLI